MNVFQSNPLAHRVALITGGTGIGRGIALAADGRGPAAVTAAAGRGGA